MNFGVDLRPSLTRPTGVGSYVLALARRLPALSPEDRFFYFSASLRDRYPAKDWPDNVTLVDRRLPVRAMNLAWNRLGWPSLDRLVGAPLDLIHSPHPLLIPGRKARQVVTLHDLFFLKHPEMTSAEVRRDYAPLVRAHVQKADTVICVSEYTAREAELLLEVPREKLAVVHNGVHPAFREPIAAEEVDRTLNRLRLPRGALLYVGSGEKRKNLVNLAIAYLGLARRRKECPPLILAGPGSDWAQGGGGVPRIHATGYLETPDLRALMAGSLALVLPSLEEGFGLPVVEAMATALPVACSRGSALQEVAGDAATLFDPLDTGSILRALERLIDDPELRERQRRAGLERSRRFDWDRAAAETLAVYRRALAQ